MATEQLKIVITAENKDALAAMRQTITTLQGVEMASGKAGKAFQSSRQAYTDLGRVIQDLPFGFTAISNNLTQLIPAAGAAGLAFSGIVSALTFAQTGTANWTRGIKGLSSSMDDLKAKMDEFRGSAAKELVEFQKLTRAAADNTRSMTERSKIVEELKSKYGGYLEGLSQEDILTGRIGQAYNTILSAMRQKIALQAAEEKVIPLLKDQLATYEKIQELQKGFASLSGIDRNNLPGGQAGESLKRDLAKFASSGAAKELVSLQKVYDQLETRIQNLFSGIGLFAKGTQIVTESFKEQTGAIKPLLTEYEKLFMARKAIVGDRAITSGNNEFRSMNLQPGMANPSAMGPQQVAGSSIFDILNREAEIQNIKAAFEKFNPIVQTLSSGLNSNLAPAFDSVFSAMANGENIGQAMSDVFKKLTIQIAASAAKAAVFSAIINSLMPAGAAAKGGGGFLNIFSGMLGFNTRSNGQGGIAGILGALQGSSLNMGGGGGNVVFRLQGPDLVAAMNRSNTSLSYRRGN